ncbi:MAG TPA: response regulator [Bacteroidales bacterium]|nr:response regulator [Bacteroidales bacterium]
MSNFDWSGKTILIAEDELINFRLLEVLLSKTKVKLLRGRDGLEALRIFTENPSIDLILMDIKMPEMDGCEVTRKIREINTSVPIIAQTAYALDEEREKSMESGCNAYITKPIDKQSLLDLINSFFGVSK